MEKRLPPPSAKGLWAIVDCNNFFASCETLFRPDLKGRPLVVLSSNDGCVIARSAEAKSLGIKMGVPAFQLKGLFEANNVEVFSSNFRLYSEVSRRVMEILAHFCPRVEQYSIDEAFLYLDGVLEACSDDFCPYLIDRVLHYAGVPVSIGLARTRTLAKLASHIAKRRRCGTFSLARDEKNMVDLLSGIRVEEVWGVGRRLAPRLHEAGVRTASDYAARPESWIKENYMLHGLRTWMELHGTVCVEAETEAARKSICTSRSFAGMIEDEEELSMKVADFAAQCARKLREEGTAALDVTVFLHTNRFRTDLEQYFPSASIRLQTAASNTQEIVSAALQGMKMIFRQGYKYKKAGVTVGNIVPAGSVQGSLFGFDPELRARNDRLSRIMDQVNTKGDSSLLRLASQKPGHYADDIRREHCSRRYSTSFDELIEVR